MEAVKTCDGFGDFYRRGGEEERGSVEIKMVADEVLFKGYDFDSFELWKGTEGKGTEGVVPGDEAEAILQLEPSGQRLMV
jgi:hypothetical protein